jgi:choline dehydrogenase-like flavoprotein
MRMAKRIYDLSIIGDGVNGCGVARDASGQGVSVYLCEQNDLASGASPAATKGFVVGRLAEVGRGMSAQGWRRDPRHQSGDYLDPSDRLRTGRRGGRERIGRISADLSPPWLGRARS